MSFCVSTLLLVCLNATDVLLREGKTQPQIGVPYVSLGENSKGWDRDYGSQTPVHPYTTGDLEELGMALWPAMFPGQDGIWLSSK